MVAGQMMMPNSLWSMPDAVSSKPNALTKKEKEEEEKKKHLPINNHLTFPIESRQQ